MEEKDFNEIVFEITAEELADNAYLGQEEGESNE